MMIKMTREQATLYADMLLKSCERMNDTLEINHYSKAIDRQSQILTEWEFDRIGNYNTIIEDIRTLHYRIEKIYRKYLEKINLTNFKIVLDIR